MIYNENSRFRKQQHTQAMETERKNLDTRFSNGTFGGNDYRHFDGVMKADRKAFDDEWDDKKKSPYAHPGILFEKHQTPRQKRIAELVRKNKR